MPRPPYRPVEVHRVVLAAAEVLQSLVTTAEAARHAGVSAAAVRQWASRGHLEATGTDDAGRPLYRLLDVAKAERATRSHARRKYPTAVA